MTTLHTHTINLDAYGFQYCKQCGQALTNYLIKKLLKEEFKHGWKTLYKRFKANQKMVQSEEAILLP